jgi:surfeit locus 1 family protein
VIRHALVWLAAVLGVALTASLGLWQLDRAAQKIERQRALDAQALQPALGGVQLAGAADASALDQRRAHLQGHWIGAATVYLDNRPMNGRAGFYVLTPLQLADGNGVILVQRGWAPRDLLDRAKLPPIDTPAGPQTVDGRITPAPHRMVALGEDASGPIRQNLDLQAFAREQRLALLPMVLVQTGAAAGGLLRDWPAPQTGADKHYGYAAQWFALAALIAGLAFWFQWWLPRKRAAAPHA